MCRHTSPLHRCRSWWAHAFAVRGPGPDFGPSDRELVDRLADFVVRRRLTAPALMLLETGRPLNFLGSQFLVFVSPLLKFVFAAAEYDRFVRILEKRASIDLIVDAISAREGARNG